MAILECKSLTKVYSVKPVINGLNLSLQAGKIYGLLGPNGCGKTTLIKMIAGLLKPSSGQILVDGKPISPETKKIVAYLPERTYLTAGMRVKDLIAFFEDFYDDFDENIAHEMLANLKIDENSSLSILSKGNKEKVQLIMVMSRRAKLYLLDEPIAGVDPAGRDYILQTIIGNYNPEACVLITTHLIHDVESALDEFIFMDFGGKVLRCGNADEVRLATGKSLDELFREDYKWGSF
ncbi:MAG: ABC transporter ATP-binding protein [Clostridia bacterium]|nr:ABC transporter ATP-binding protein [Clostridia bacterium]